MALQAYSVTLLVEVSRTIVYAAQAMAGDRLVENFNSSPPSVGEVLGVVELGRGLGVEFEHG